jgi:hypothetical protein
LAARSSEQVIAALARDVIADVRPEDVRYFDTDACAYFDDPGRTLGRVGQRTTLGSGLEAVAVALTPVVLYAGQKVVDYVVEHVLRDAHQRLRRRRAEVTSVEGLGPLDAGQRERVRQLVAQCLEEHGIESQLADRVSRAFVTRLPHRDEPSGPPGGA